MTVAERISAFYGFEALPENVEAGALLRLLFESRYVAYINGIFYTVDPVAYAPNGAPKNSTLTAANHLKTMQRNVEDLPLITPLYGLTVAEFLAAENDALNRAERAFNAALFRAGVLPIFAVESADVDDFKKAFSLAQAGKMPVVSRAVYDMVKAWVDVPTTDIAGVQSALKDAREAFATKSGNVVYLPDRERMTAQEVGTIDRDCHTLPRLIVENINAGFEALGLETRIYHRGCDGDGADATGEEVQDERDNTADYTVRDDRSAGGGSDMAVADA